MKIFWNILTSLIIITLHFKIFSLGGSFDVSPTLILIPIWLFITFKNTGAISINSRLLLVLIISSLPFLSFNIQNWIEFFKTYFQFVISVVLCVLAWRCKPKCNDKLLSNVILNIQLILVATLVVQYVFCILIGDVNYYNVFGENQLYFSREFNIEKQRLKAFYLEPSYLGLVAVNLFWVRSYLKVKRSGKYQNLILTLIILFFTKSAFAYFSFSSILLFKMYYELRVKTEYKLFCYLLFLFGLILYRDELYHLFRFNELSSYSLTGQGASGFMRLVLPIILLKVVLKDGYFMGLTFGQLEEYKLTFIEKYGETGMDNSFFAILVYFGIVGAIIYLALFYKFYSTKSIVFKSFIMLTFLNLTNSGAFMTSQYAFVTILLPFLILNKNEKNIYNYCYYERQSRVNEYLQQYKGFSKL